MCVAVSPFHSISHSPLPPSAPQLSQEVLAAGAPFALRAGWSQVTRDRFKGSLAAELAFL